MIRRRFIADINRRFRKLKAAITDFLVIKDALALEEAEQLSPLSVFADPKEFIFATDPGKLEAFNDWFRQQIDTNVFTPGGFTGTHNLTTQYVESAYKRGQLNAYFASKQGQFAGELGVGEQTSEEFLRSSFNAPETLSKLKLLGTRTFEDLKGVTTTMSANMSRILADGLAAGRNPRDIAREMNASIDSLGKRRAATIARTEVIHAHAEGQLDAFSRLGVEELGIQAEWQTAGDNRVCTECQDREGETFSIEEARGLIPLHPNCVLGDSLVECSDALALTRVRYHGKIFHVTTRERQFSITEHHTLLTRRGWCFAKDLLQGDELIDASSVDRSFVQYPNQNDRISTISNVFESVAEMLPEQVRVISGPSAEYFHGDGGSIDKEIDVILADRELGNQDHVSSFAKSKQHSLMGRDISSFHPQLLNGQSPSSLFLKRLASAADRFMCRRSVGAVLARRPLSHLKSISLLLSSNSDTSKLQSLFDSPSASWTLAKQNSQLQETLPESVLFDKIVDIKVEEPGGRGVFVFDVSTHSTMYALNGILSSNCRCTWVPVQKKTNKTGQKPAQPPVPTVPRQGFEDTANFIAQGTRGFEMASQGHLPGNLTNPFGELLDPKSLDFYRGLGRAPEIRGMDEFVKIAGDKRFLVPDKRRYFFGIDEQGLKAAATPEGDELRFFGTRYMGLTRERASNYATQGSTRGAVVEVTVPKGTRVAHALAFDEPEALMLPGSRMRIISQGTRTIDGKATRYIRAEVTDDGTAFVKKQAETVKKLQETRAPAPSPPTPKPRGFQDINSKLDVKDFDAQRSANYEFGKAMHGDQIFSRKQFKAAKTYQGNDFEGINKTLRRGRSDGYHAETISNLDELTKSGTIPEDTWLYRGISDRFNDVKAGAIIEDQAYMSTTTNPRIVSSFTRKGVEPLAIRAPKGANGMSMNRVVASDAVNASHESEILLPRGSRLRMTDEKVTRKVYQKWNDEVVEKTFRVVDLII